MLYHHPMPPDPQRRLLSRFLEENAKLNLSALRTEDACWHGNILDSLALMDVLQPGGAIPVPATLIDIGTGGGFPLLPLAIALPEAQCTGLDSIRKKIDTIGRIAADLHLTNVQLIAERTERAGRDPALRDAFDLVTARAVAALPQLLEHAAPFAKPGGHLVCWKSLHIAEELAASAEAQRALHCPLIARHTYDLGGDWGTRQLLIFRKEAPTPKRFPREVGVAGKTPLTPPSPARTADPPGEGAIHRAQDNHHKTQCSFLKLTSPAFAVQ